VQQAHSAEAQLAEIASCLRRGFGVARLSDFTSAEQQELLNEKLDQCSLEEVNEVWLASDEYARRVAQKQAQHELELARIIAGV